MANRLILSPADILSHLLVERGLGTDPEDQGLWPVFVNVRPDDPSNLIVTNDILGQEDGRLMPTGEAAEHLGFQIIIRGKTQPVAWVKADAIHHDMSRAFTSTSFVVGAYTYTVKKLVRISPLLRMGLERRASKRFLYSINGLALIGAEETDAVVIPDNALTDHEGNYLLDHEGNYLLGV